MKKYIFKYRYYAGLAGDKHWSEKTIEFEAVNDALAKIEVKQVWQRIKDKFVSDADAKKHLDVYEFISLERVQTRKVDIGLETIR